MCSLGNLDKDKILVPVPDSSPRCARCGTPVDGPSCRGCAFLRKEFEENLITYCVTNGIFKDFQDTSESSDDNTNVVNALREPCVVNQDPGEEIDEVYERECEIRIRKLKQDFNEWGSKVRKKEQAYEEESISAARVTCFFLFLVMPWIEFDSFKRYYCRNSTHLDTIPTTNQTSNKSVVENLVPITSEFEGISDNMCDVPNCDDNRVNVESDFVESLVNRDTSVVYSSKIDPFQEEFAGELAHIAPIPPGIVKADFNDTSSDDDDFEDIEYVSLKEVNEVDQEKEEFDLEDILQIQDVILREKLLNVHHLISKIESLKDNPTLDHVLESPYPFPIPIMDSDLSDTSLSFSDNSLPEFEPFSDHTEETRSGSTTTHANYSLLEYESFHF
ncbi:hypothetical protein Tco_0713114, partial [Tanacetum coccineum]